MQDTGREFQSAAVKGTKLAECRTELAAGRNEIRCKTCKTKYAQRGWVKRPSAHILRTHILWKYL